MTGLIMKVISIMTKLMGKEFFITGKTVQLMTDNGLINDSTVTDNFSIKSHNNYRKNSLTTTGTSLTISGSSTKVNSQMIINMVMAN